jgi:hypothetical protein
MSLRDKFCVIVRRSMDTSTIVMMAAAAMFREAN